jgi:hypothetical protein
MLIYPTAGASVFRSPGILRTTSSSAPAAPSARPKPATRPIDQSPQWNPPDRTISTGAGVEKMRGQPPPLLLRQELGDRVGREARGSDRARIASTPALLRVDPFDRRLRRRRVSGVAVDDPIAGRRSTGEALEGSAIPCQRRPSAFMPWAVGADCASSRSR